MKEQKQVSRRSFLAMLGTGAAALAAASTGLDSFIGKASAATWTPKPTALPFPALQPVTTDYLLAADGYTIDVLAHHGDSLRGTAQLGVGGGYVGFRPGTDASTGLVWVNHTALPNHAADNRGVSVMGVKRTANGSWSLDKENPAARRLTASERVQLTGKAKGSKAVHGASVTQGIWSNGSGGATLWGTAFVGEQTNDTQAAQTGMPPSSYGWLAEFDPSDSSFKPRKHSALGRFAHGHAVTTLSKNGRVVVYMGGQHALYKFVSSGQYHAGNGTANSSLLEEGTLYAADLGKGNWIALNASAIAPILADRTFKVPAGVTWLREDLIDMLQDEASVLTNAHEAALVLGATRLENATGIALHPADGSLFITQTGNAEAGNGFGSIMRLVEQQDDAASLSFEADLTTAGGRQAGFSSPNSALFDDAGRLWLSTAIPASRLNEGSYAAFGNNAIYALSPSGETFAKAESFAYAPANATLASVAFGAGDTLFTVVQQQNEPSSSVVAIRKK
ncbi:hypothetical protein FHS18_004079 [Paenibacillus phyllosphaerae]|uniref:DUF839 domain-containing protein n=1 Tax=Paenibacillus phyllosphaerae TaxID=274593 RepID=A0A7W5FP52_9BACL|nr:alkaline phosphatase PhoX [Paenibacillus phyllosphaerae]MBB3112001.1 hypothetical protein [Paenibacillus phyllosphaerae]